MELLTSVVRESLTPELATFRRLYPTALSTASLSKLPPRRFISPNCQDTFRRFQLGCLRPLDAHAGRGAHVTSKNKCPRERSVRGEPGRALPTTSGRWQLKRLVWPRFSPLAASHGFYCAQKRSYVADGLPYNWTIQKRHFPTFTPILDFVRAVKHLDAAARAASDDDNATW